MPYKKRAAYDDATLRKMALSRGMGSVPKELETLKKMLHDTNNSITKERVLLGRELFFDANLSLDKQHSCASCHMLAKDPHNRRQFLDDITDPESKTDCMVCHIQDESGSDRLATAVGVDGKEDRYHRNTLSILNASLAKYQMWDGSSKSSLASVAKMLHDSQKMGLSKEQLLDYIAHNPYYKEHFAVLSLEITLQNIYELIDSYQKTVVTRSAYDAFLEGDDSAMSEEAKRGFRNFIELGCKGCHTGVSVGGQSLQKFPTRDYNYIINVTSRFDSRYIGRDVASIEFNFREHHDFPFENRGGFLGAKQQQLFRVPILRNVTKTSPYFHNGAIFDLREAIYIMGKYQLSTELTEQQIDEIAAFLKTLEGEVVMYKELQ
jgi:cytochrome c peroxidase